MREAPEQPADAGPVVERVVGPLEPKRGILHPDLTHMRETRRGTQYEVCEWTCPKCRQGRSTLYIDGEWCHGESYHIAFGKGQHGEPAEQCGTCWRAEIDAMPSNSKRPNVRANRPARGPQEYRMSNDQTPAADRGSALSEGLGPVWP